MIAYWRAQICYAQADRELYLALHSNQCLFHHHICQYKLYRQDAKRAAHIAMRALKEKP